MLTQKEGEIVLRYYTDRQSVRQIARRLGYAQDYVRRVLHKFHVENPSVMPGDPMSRTPEQGCDCAICQGWKEGDE